MSILENCKARIVEMERLLSEEFTQLSEGRTDALVQLSTQKMKAMALLEGALSQLNEEDDLEVIAPSVDKVRRLAQENGVMLKTILNGVKSARDRLKTLKHSNAKVGAYNRAGTRLFLSEDQINSEKRI